MGNVQARMSQGYPPRSEIHRKPRKSKTNKKSLPSLFWPHVLARERLLCWTTPFAIAHQAHLLRYFPVSSLDAVHCVAEAHLDPSTRASYSSGLMCFNQHCDAYNVPEEAQIPASKFLLSSFISAHAGKVSKSAVNNWLAGLEFWHTLNGAPWHGRRLLRLVKGGVFEVAPSGSKRAKRQPVTIQHMHTLLRGLDLTDSFDAAVFVVACIAFWCCCRLGELVISSLSNFDYLKHVSRAAGVMFSQTPNGTHFAFFHIPWSKTTGFDGADIVASDIQDPTSPVYALRQHLYANKDVPDSTPFFAWQTADGSWAPMTKDWFMSRCNEVWVEAGLSQLTGHCFRIGGATELLLRCNSPDVVAAQGHWKSRAFLEYWRRIESILPVFIVDSFLDSRAQFVSDSISIWRKRVGL